MQRKRECKPILHLHWHAWYCWLDASRFKALQSRQLMLQGNHKRYCMNNNVAFPTYLQGGEWRFLVIGTGIAPSTIPSWKHFSETVIPKLCEEMTVWCPSIVTYLTLICMIHSFGCSTCQMIPSAHPYTACCAETTMCKEDKGVDIIPCKLLHWNRLSMHEWSNSHPCAIQTGSQAVTV